jgi:hypothetical protein
MSTMVINQVGVVQLSKPLGSSAVVHLYLRLCTCANAVIGQQGQAGVCDMQYALRNDVSYKPLINSNNNNNLNNVNNNNMTMMVLMTCNMIQYR